MELRIEEEPIDRLDEHALISIAFTVERVLVVSLEGSGLGGIRLSETRVDLPWVKDYDLIKGEGPTRWPKRFDTSNWGLIAAYDKTERVGGAVIAVNTAGAHMLEGAPGTAVLWDLRVSPAHRASGGRLGVVRSRRGLVPAATCRHLMVETQNVNVPACRFYARVGCGLVAIDTRAYPELPDEARLVWSKDLAP